MVWGVIIVSFLFALVHVSQYHNNLGVIAVISILSVVLTLSRALTGKILPSFTIHTIFNGIQSLYLVFQPYIEKHDAGSEQKAAALLQLARFVKHFV
jgi:membrane protease YdiL (CAAX protease family)